MRIRGHRLAVTAFAACLCQTVWAMDTAVTTCHDTDLKPSISADDNSGRILMSEAPGTLSIQPYSTKGDYLVIKLPDGTPTGTSVHVTETGRDTRISSELKLILAASRPAQQTFGPGAEAPPYTFPCVRYLQQLPRSTITVDFPAPVMTTAGAGASANLAQAQAGPVQKQFIAGPPEHYYLSADLPITKAKQLTYDAQKSTVVEATVPQTFYLGLNFKAGDVYTRAEDAAAFYDNFSFKLLAQITAPANSYGYGVGYEFDRFTVFVARVYTRNESTVSSPTSATTLSTIAGVSFNIENGIKWLAGK